MLRPKNVMKYSKAFLHESNILEKMELNSNPFYYYKLLNKHTAPNTIDINSFDNFKRFIKQYVSSAMNTKFHEDDNSFIKEIDKKPCKKGNRFQIIFYFLALINKVIPPIKNIMLPIHADRIGLNCPLKPID